ncbi:MAG: Stf0 family sulfotransferase [Fulvivirga sp.]
MTSQFPLNYEPGVHEREISKNLNLSIPSGFEKKLNNVKLIFICFSNRSGSTWLCDLLSNHPHLNLGGEGLNHPQVLKKSEENGFKSFAEYFVWLVKERKTESNNFVIKVSWDQLFFLTKIGLIPILAKQSKFIQIFRMNILNQAISYSIALQNEQWNSKQRGKIVEVEYRPDLIHAGIIDFTQANMMFDRYFTTFNVKRKKIIYENLTSNRIGILTKTLNYLGLPDIPKSKLAKNRLKVQRNELNSKFAEEFKSRHSF